jgi:hypothetical protein
MSRCASTCALLLGSALLALIPLYQARAQPGYVPQFHKGPLGWQHAFGGDFPPVPGSALPVWNDPAHPFISNEMARINRMQSNYRIGDISNPNLKQWAKDVMKKDNDEVLAGKIAFSVGQSCRPPGVPAFSLTPGPLLFLQTLTKITIVAQGGQHVRHVYMNVPHSANVAPSWFGESVGRYEGDTLVVDSIGLSTKSFVDSYRTPHTDKLHVVERYRIVDGGDTLEVRIRVEDPDTFVQPWETLVQYRPAQEPFGENICQEGNFVLFSENYGVPKADRPDF